MRKKAINVGFLVMRSQRDAQVLAKAKFNKKIVDIDSIAIEFSKIYANEQKSLRELYKDGYSISHYHRALELGILQLRSSTESAKLVRIKYDPPVMGEEARKLLSERQSLQNTGGRCKWYAVSGVKVQGTWERDIANKFNELNIKWIKPTINRDIWTYLINDIEKSYTPDFYLPEHNIYLEIKGFWWGNDKKKMECVLDQHRDKYLIIIQKHEFKLILNNDLTPLKLTG